MVVEHIRVSGELVNESLVQFFVQFGLCFRIIDNPLGSPGLVNGRDVSQEILLVVSCQH